MRRWPVSLLLLAVASACSSGRGSAAGCSAPVNERLDPASVIHLFPGAPEPHYLTDPPTSGPHQLGTQPAGVVTTPIPRPRQVAILESGVVLIQHDGPDVPAVDALAGPLVTVAPAVGKLPSPVVVTAWTWKLACRGADKPAVAAIRAFIAAHQGVGFSR